MPAEEEEEEPLQTLPQESSEGIEYEVSGNTLTITNTNSDDGDPVAYDDFHRIDYRLVSADGRTTTLTTYCNDNHRGNANCSALSADNTDGNQAIALTISRGGSYAVQVYHENGSAGDSASPVTLRTEFTVTVGEPSTHKIVTNPYSDVLHLRPYEFHNSGQYTVSLYQLAKTSNAAPAGDVTVTIDTPSGVTATPETLTFTTADWYRKRGNSGFHTLDQTVTITFDDSAAIDQDLRITHFTGPAEALNPAGLEFSARTSSVDLYIAPAQDVPVVSISASSLNLVAADGRAEGSYQLKINSQPAADEPVTVHITVLEVDLSDPDNPQLVPPGRALQIVLSGKYYTDAVTMAFTADNWGRPRTVDLLSRGAADGTRFVVQHEFRCGQSKCHPNKYRFFRYPNITVTLSD